MARPGDLKCAEHFKFAGKRLHIVLSLLLTCISSHGFIPDTFMKSIIIPLIKDKAGDITDKTNYRPIALSTISSKIYERIILNRYDDLLTTTDNQFGFKKGYSTDMCIYSYKRSDMGRLQGPCNRLRLRLLEHIMITITITIT